MTTMHRRLATLESRITRAEDDESGDASLKFEGHAAVFRQATLIGSRDWGFVEWIEPGAFSDVLEDDVRFLFNHDGLPMARTTNGTLQLSEDKTGLVAHADLAPISLSRDLAVLIERGDVTQMSFAFFPGQMINGRIPDKDGDEDAERAKESGVTLPKGVAEKYRGMPFSAILKMDRLFDVSPVTYPAYEGTDIEKLSDKVEAEVRAFMTEYSAQRGGVVAPKHRRHRLSTSKER